MSYSFLATLTLKDLGRQKQPKELNPTGLALRIFSTGKVYPSQELVNKFDLEYKPRVTDREQEGNGLDVFDSHAWTPLKEYPRMIMFYSIPRKEIKVELFARCLYNDSNNPKSSVMSQGAESPFLLGLCKSMGYLTDDQKYVDLVMVDVPVTPEEGIAYIPKKIEKGPKAGEETYERREHVVLYPFNTPENLEKIKEEEKRSGIEENTVVAELETSSI